MKISHIAAIIEEVAPLGAQEDFDNAGLIVGNPEAEVDKALLCVDITPEVVAEATEAGVGMIIAHHPIIFHPLKRLTDGTYVERAVAEAIRRGIALYAAHTNLDNVRGGLSFHLAKLFGLKDVGFLAPSAEKPGTGTGAVGELPSPAPVMEFLQMVKERLGLEVVRHSAHTTASTGGSASTLSGTVRRVAICSGSGASFIPAAKASGADIYLAGDLRYNDFLGADTGMIVADIGHYESEYCAKEIVFDIIRKKLPNFALLRSVREKNPVKYLK